MKQQVLILLFAIGFLNTRAQRIAPDTLSGRQGTLVIQPIVHASLVVTGSNKVIYADPTGGAINYKGLNPPDIIVITDIHGDHFDIPTIEAIKGPHTVLVVPPAAADQLPP